MWYIIYITERLLHFSYALGDKDQPLKKFSHRNQFSDILLMLPPQVHAQNSYIKRVVRSVLLNNSRKVDKGKCAYFGLGSATGSLYTPKRWCTGIYPYLPKTSPMTFYFGRDKVTISAD
jgi:hypothetical protein